MARGVKGFYLRPDLFVTADGRLLQAFETPGLGAINWKDVGTYFLPFVAAGAGWVASRGQPKEVPYTQAPPGGVQVGATSQGLFGGIDTTTLLLIGGAILLFMSNPARK